MTVLVGGSLPSSPLPLQVFSWARLGVVVQCLGSIGLLATLEVVFKEQRRWA